MHFFENHFLMNSYFFRYVKNRLNLFLVTRNTDCFNDLNYIEAKSRIFTGRLQCVCSECMNAQVMLHYPANQPCCLHATPKSVSTQL